MNPAAHISPAKPRIYYYPCRCRRCGTRKTLRMHPDHYYRRRYARCPACKADDMRVDTYRASGREAKRYLCHCDHYGFPHRRGSLLCEHGVMGREGFSQWSVGCPEHDEREHALFEAFLAEHRGEPHHQQREAA
ncbi:hypothetical protein [Algiphilus sp.]|uniref:hypothetical protein n=1 Tax=Algiphilus sp. TaxID=1872431 RepID=UPI0025B8F62E|nr:hypothetical protein [Algiphilus sp.]MCK5769500.1 hypothetical protein [Algiphilus sp.]